jgi:hypothetical protein
MPSNRHSPFNNRRKQDGSHDSICLGCFKTFSNLDAKGRPTDEDHDHICAFAFPDRRATASSLASGHNRRRSDLDWQLLISSDDAIAAD